MPAPAGAEGLRLDDQEVNVGVGPRIAPGTGPEEDHLLGIDLVDDGSDHPREECVVDVGHRVSSSFMLP